MATRVNFDVGVLRTQLLQASDRARYALANQVLLDSNNYAPRKTGDLRRMSFVSSDNKSIVWSAPYARRLYFQQFSNYTTPGTGPQWVDRAAASHMAHWLEIVRSEF